MVDPLAVAVSDGVDELEADTASTFVVPPKGVPLSLGIEHVAARDVVADHPPAFAFVVDDGPVQGEDVGVIRDPSVHVGLVLELGKSLSVLSRRHLLARRQGREAEPLDGVDGVFWVEDVDGLVDDAKAALAEDG
jgi:hypothetical protein